MSGFVIPKLKPVGWEKVDDGVRVVLDPRASVELADTDGAVTRLLELLAEGGRSIAELTDALKSTHPSGSEPEVTAAIDVLDGLLLVEDERRMGGLSEAERLRHFSNLAFFRTFTNLDMSAEDVVRRLRGSHVLMLGARQFVYRRCDVGRAKVQRAAEWVGEFDPTIEVEAIQAEFMCVEDVAQLVDLVRPDAVSDAVDSPQDIDTWVNAACVAAGVPFCRGGMGVTESVVWSVDPGRSACLACRQPDPGEAATDLRLHLSTLHAAAVPRVNRGAGPVATQLGSLVAFELTRFLTGYAPPVYAGGVAVIDLASDCGQTVVRNARDPDCAVCRSASLGGSG
jgi:molybdopterin-synthase adenylyltransferase